MAQDERPSIFFESVDSSTSLTTPETKIDIIPTTEDDITQLLTPETLYQSDVPAEKKEPIPPLQPINPVESTATESTPIANPEEKSHAHENTWAIWDENSGKPRNSRLLGVNSTMPYALTNPAAPLEMTATQLNPASPTSPTSLEQTSETISSTVVTTTPSGSGSLQTSSSAQSFDEVIPLTTQSASNVKTETSTSLTSLRTSEPAALEQSIISTASSVSPLNSVYGAESSSTTGTMLTGMEVAPTLTQYLSSTTASSSSSYSGLDSWQSNSTLPKTSNNFKPTQESSSLYDAKSTPSDSFYLSTAQSSITFSSSVQSGINATQTIPTTSSTLTPSIIGLQPLPANSSTSIQTSSTFTSGTAIYPSITSSSSLLPISGNTTATSSLDFSTITIPLLTSTSTLPQQSSSLSRNITYTPISPSNSTSYLSLPSSTPTSVLTTSSSSAPTIIMPTATNTASTFIPSSIIAQTSSTHTSGQTTTLSTGIPSALPKIVQNPLSSSTPAQPEDTFEVQIGFEWALNYPFVVSHPLSTTQIFTYLPIGIADGLGLKPEQIVVKNLLPLDTTAELQFITTVARVFIPTSMVDTLRVDLGIAASPIYKNPDESVNTLMNYINPAVPFFPGATLDPGSSPTGTDNKTTQNSRPGDAGVYNSGTQQNQSASAKGTTAGIALAACGGAAAYGAAMFLLARRYKHRQQRQKQSAFVDYSSEAAEEAPGAVSSGHFGDGGPLMSGGRISPTHDRHSRGSGRTGYSTRNAQISAPMMTENSLGWS